MIERDDLGKLKKSRVPFPNLCSTLSVLLVAKIRDSCLMHGLIWSLCRGVCHHAVATTRFQVLFRVHACLHPFCPILHFVVPGPRASPRLLECAWLGCRLAWCSTANSSPPLVVVMLKSQQLIVPNQYYHFYNYHHFRRFNLCVHGSTMCF